MKTFLLVVCVIFTALPFMDTLSTKYGNYQKAMADSHRPKFIQANANMQGTTAYQEHSDDIQVGCVLAIMNIVKKFPVPPTAESLQWNLHLCLLRNGVTV